MLHDVAVGWVGNVESVVPLLAADDDSEFEVVAWGAFFKGASGDVDNAGITVFGRIGCDIILLFFGVDLALLSVVDRENVTEIVVEFADFPLVFISTQVRKNEGEDQDNNGGNEQIWGSISPETTLMVLVFFFHNVSFLGESRWKIHPKGVLGNTIALISLPR